jgi:REP element-mobilizing transposase RayT
MARPLRIELAGGLYHVTSRGDRREDIYLDDGDRYLWLDVLDQTCRRFNWICHAWCQMTNHYHLVMETVEGNLSEGMRHLNGVYTQAVNRKHRRVGHVFQGRYKAILVDKDSHLLELSRYVVLNPVRAAMVQDAEEWPWSSFRNMIGRAQPPAWLQTDWLLAQFGDTRDIAILRYAEFVRAGVRLPSIWTGLRNQVFLGDEEFVRRAQAQTDRLDIAEIPRAQRRPPAKGLDHYRATAESNAKAMVAAFASGDYTMVEIARHFGVHYSTVSRAVRRGESEAAGASGLDDCKT